ncbi:MAG: YceD family protein [Syntrophomonadaceae bacterium]
MKPATLSLDAVLDEPVRFAEVLSVPAAAFDREPLVAISPLELTGEVSRIDGGYALSGRLVYGGELECSRCLAAYPFREDETFTLLLYPRRPPSEGEREIAKDELDALYYDEPVVALAPIAEERVQMALPMKPLCRPDCRGLCPGCGKDLNLDPCGCAHESDDPRWEALRALKEKV